jgi:hypothetical protein
MKFSRHQLAEEIAFRRACRPLPFSAETFLAEIQGRVLLARWGFDFRSKP